MARIIRAVMEEDFDEPVDPRDIPREFAFQTVHGRALCRGCRKCKKSWSTYLAWLTLDLRGQRIAKSWQQKCQSCQTPNQLWFPPEELERMVAVAIERMWKLQDGTYVSGRGQNQDRPAPHLQSLCERCEYGRRKCWLGRGGGQ
ncbi:uncharacterized protein LOC119744361 [Patiria miniata]|uniref:3CxxC-type domain-containing protein n=1 Tax=Patiria miniata TaxID=46514 RepID=A0A914BK39_PATMI|nr:uncharacterized protein LOC119744361 [Patiria miniata]